MMTSSSDVRLLWFPYSLPQSYLSKGSLILIWLCNMTFLILNNNVLWIHAMFVNSLFVWQPVLLGIS